MTTSVTLMKDAVPNACSTRIVHLIRLASVINVRILAPAHADRTRIVRLSAICPLAPADRDSRANRSPTAMLSLCNVRIHLFDPSELYSFRNRQSHIDFFSLQPSWNKNPLIRADPHPADPTVGAEKLTVKPSVPACRNMSVLPQDAGRSAFSVPNALPTRRALIKSAGIRAPAPAVPTPAAT